MRLPAMPAKKIDGDCCTSTITKRASNCSDWLRAKCGQSSAPGMISCRLLIIWQPLHTPSAKVSAALEEGGELVARARIEQDGLGPALARAQHVAVGEAAAGRETLEVAQG